jgi:DNA mismatch endonuclease (patch repair protein)
MQSVKTKDTGPELQVRRMLFGLGFRYRLHDKRLPGRPDIVFSKKRKAIFVHGCFWHGHECSKGNAPKSKLEYWGPKLAANIERDAMQVKQIEQLGWSVLTLWQCQLKDSNALRELILSFLQDVPAGPIDKRLGIG